MDFRIVRTPKPVYVSTEEQARPWVEFFAAEALAQGIGVDTETTGLDLLKDRVRFFSLAVDDARICAPVRLLPLFADIIEDPQTEKHLSNAKYDQHLLWNHEVRLDGFVVDTVDMDFLIDENRQHHGLKETALDYLGLRMNHFKDVFGVAGTVDDEVRTLCEIHDILELYDYFGEREAAQKQARDVLLRLKRVSGDPKVLDAVRKLHLSLRAKNCTLTARQVVTIAEQHGLVQEHVGVRRHVSEFMSLLGCLGEIPPERRKDLVAYTEDPALLREVTEVVFAQLLALTGIPDDPVGELRKGTADYASLDAWASHTLVPVLRDRLSDPDMRMITDDVRAGTEPAIRLVDHYDEERVPYLQVLWCMERLGMRIDVAAINGYAGDMQKELDRLGKDVVAKTGNLNFNPDSTDQLRDVLFTKDASGDYKDPFGDPPRKLTKIGREPAVDKEVLEDFAGKGDDLCETILEYRQFAKLHGTYAVGLPRWVDAFCRIHCTLQPWGTVTWRLSAKDPNLMQIPQKGAWGKKIRGVFVAGLWGDCDPDICLPEVRDVPLPDLPPNQRMRLYISDYKQVEMCIMADRSGDENMIGAINAGKDLHCLTVELASNLGAAELPRGITYADVKAAKKVADIEGHVLTVIEEMLIAARGKLKACGFGIIYGIGALKLGMQLGLKIVRIRGRDTCPEAQELIDQYLYAIYPGVGQYIKDTIKRCEDELTVYTLQGHPRRLPDIVSTERKIRAQAQRQAPNAEIQGSAADIIKRAMLKIARSRLLRSLGVRMLMQVHDELILEVPDIPEILAVAKPEVKRLMENPFPMRVPILVDLHEGYSWAAKG